MAYEIIEFLTRMVEMDESLAKSATEGPWRYNDQKVWIPKDDKGRFVVGMREEYVAAGPAQEPFCVAVTGFEDDRHPIANARFIGCMDPSRALRAVAAKRRTMARHTPAEVKSRWERPWCRGCQWGGPCDDPWTEDIDECPELRDMATEYMNMPGFQLRWLND